MPVFFIACIIAFLLLHECLESPRLKWTLCAGVVDCVLFSVTPPTEGQKRFGNHCSFFLLFPNIHSTLGELDHWWLGFSDVQTTTRCLAEAAHVRGHGCTDTSTDLADSTVGDGKSPQRYWIDTGLAQEGGVFLSCPTSLRRRRRRKRRRRRMAMSKWMETTMRSQTYTHTIGNWVKLRVGEIFPTKSR